MSNVTADFVASPGTFLTQKIVFVANVAESGKGTVPGVCKVYFWKVNDHVVELKERRFGKVPAEVLDAYWLPWETLKATTLDLGDKADYMFTSQMTGCRFTILDDESGKIKVAHIAGTLSQPDRQKEQDKLVQKMGGDQKVRARSLSVSGVSEHGYGGQTANPGSAFVYGVRDKDKGTWSFGAQIVGAKLLSTASYQNLTSESIKKAFAF